MDFNRQNIFQATSAKTAVWDAGYNKVGMPDPKNIT